MSLFDGILLVFTLILLILTLLPLSRRKDWWIRVLDFPRMQLAIAGVALLLILLLFAELTTFSISLSAIVIACIAYHLWWIVPFTPLLRKAVADANGEKADDRLSILAANVLQTSARAEAFLAIVRREQPDLLVTLETNAWWQERLDALEADYPYSVKCAQENLYGMHLYSRLPLMNAHVHFLIEDDVPSIHAEVQLLSPRRVHLRFVHPTPPAPGEHDDSEERDAELLVIGKEVREIDAPVVVAGDLNDVAWSRTSRLFRKISRLLDPRLGRGIYNTFHAGHWYLRWPLDHFFVSRHFQLERLERLESFGSDHFPVLIRLILAPDSGNPDERASRREARQAEQEAHADLRR
jgi:endonuclease/exonuclease/phosphatase (EEP) superfamily protein YafD